MPESSPQKRGLEDTNGTKRGCSDNPEILEFMQEERSAYSEVREGICDSRGGLDFRMCSEKGSDDIVLKIAKSQDPLWLCVN